MTDHDEELDEFTRYVLRQLDPAPPTPRDEIWARIETARAARGIVRGPVAVAPRSGTRPGRTAWVQWGAGLAAMLLLGIGLGRVSMPDAVEPDASVTAATETGPANSAPNGSGGYPASQVPAAYQVATTQHLQRTEALLTSLAIDVETRGTAEVSGWARELLTDTRLLLGSPAAADAETLRLLEELELVLSQIAAIPSARAIEEVELIEDAINQSDVLLRMRAATTGRRLVGT